MFVNRSSVLRSISTALILSTPLMVGACSPKDKGPSAEKSTTLADLSLKSPEQKAFAHYFDVPKRSVSESEAKEALAQLSLLESSEDNLSWDKSSGKAGSYIYSGLAAKSDDGTLSIERAELFGVHMEGKTATFDRADFSGIKIYDEKDDLTISFANMRMAKPTPAMAKSIIQSLSHFNDIEDLGLENPEGGMGFGALAVSDMKISSPELNGGVNAVMWGENQETGLADILIDDIGINFESKQGETGELKLGEFSAVGLRSSLLKGAGVNSSMVGKFGSMGKNFDQVKLENLNFDSAAIAINTKGFAGKASEKNGVTTIKQASQPLTLTFGLTN